MFTPLFLECLRWGSIPFLDFVLLFWGCFLALLTPETAIIDIVGGKSIF